MLFSSKRFQTSTLLVVWLLTVLVWTPMTMLSHIGSSQAAMHSSVIMDSMPGSQQETTSQHDCGGVDCGNILHNMGNCDLACQPMVSSVNNEIRTIRSTDSYLLVEPKFFPTISLVAIERPPKHSV